MRGLTLWFFDATPPAAGLPVTGDPDELIAYANLSGVAYLLAMTVYAVLASAITMRRYQKAD